MRALVLLSCLLCSGWCIGSVSETPQFRHVGVAEGLPSSRTTSLALDQDGYLWVGTRDGLARYDGVGYRVYQYQPGNRLGLLGNFVQTVFVDAGNRVWVSIEGQGLSVLDAERREFRHFNQANQPLMQSNDVWPIVATPDGALWFGTFGGGLYRLDGEERMTRFLPTANNAHSLPAENVLALAIDTQGVLWVGTTKGLARWTEHGFETLPSQALSGTVVFSLSAEDDGSLWIGTDQGLDHRLADGRIEKPAWRTQLPDKGVTSVLRDREGIRWITTRLGLVSENKGVIHTLEGDEAVGTFMFQGLQDPEGGLWFVTLNDGLLRLPTGWQNFAVFGRSDSNQGLSSPTVQASALSRNGRVWLVGASGMLDLLDPTSKRIEHYLQNSVLSDNLLWSVLERRDGSVWMGHQQGLSRYDPLTGALRHWRIGEGDQPLLPGPVNHLVETGDGLLWLASYGGGLQARDLEGRLVHSLTPHNGKGLQSPEQRQLAVGPDAALWVAGPSGLLRWNATRQHLEKIAGVPNDLVYGFTFVSPDTIWLHRMGALEAYRWNGVDLTRFQHVGITEGLPAVASGGISADRNGVLWLTTTRGLLRYDPSGKRLRLFGVRDGLPSQEFQPWPPLITAQGWGLASTNAGLVLFDPSRIRASNSKPHLVIDSISVRRGEQAIALSPNSAPLTVGPNDRDLRISARLLSFTDSKTHRYRFWLHGYDPGWVSVNTSGERVFSRLEPGSYRLEIRATNADGVWSDRRELAFTVQAPWWQTRWAKILWGIAALLLLWLIAQQYQARFRKRHDESLRRQKQQLAEQESEAKTRFLATLGHEIRTPMTGVLGMSELLLHGTLQDKQRHQVESIQYAGQHLLRLVNDALDLARIEAGKLKLHDEAFDTQVLLAEVFALLRPLAEVKGLAFSLQHGSGTPQVVRGDKDRVRQILLNLGSNAIKFTEQGEVMIRTAPLMPQGLLLEVSDTGPGLNAEQQARLFQRFEQAEGARTSQRYGGSGLGLAISQELAGAMDGRIEVESVSGFGARFRVMLPLANADPKEIVGGVAPGENPKSKSLRLLVVEDDAMVAEVIIGLLQSLGHHVTHAAQALAALTELQNDCFDLAFLDLDLPGLDGFELAKLIQTQSYSLPLIALTARADAQAEPLARAAGMQGFVRKPVTSDILAGAIKEVFDSVGAA